MRALSALSLVVGSGPSVAVSAYNEVGMIKELKFKFKVIPETNTK